jgi:hypothetical protein
MPRVEIGDMVANFEWISTFYIISLYLASSQLFRLENIRELIMILCAPLRFRKVEFEVDKLMFQVKVFFRYVIQINSPVTPNSKVYF